METLRKQANREQQLLREVASLRSRLAEAEETLRAIRTGEVDALVISNHDGQQVFTLKGAEHGYRVLVQTMNEGAVTLSRDGTILYCNQNFATMVRLALERVIGGSIARFVPESERPAFTKLHHGTQGRKGELAMLAHDGTLVPVFVAVSDLKVDGVPDAVCLVFTDLTDQKRNAEIHAAREALLESSQRYRSLIEATAQIIWTTTPEGEMAGDQPGWSGFTGQTEAERRGQGWIDAVHPEDRAETQAKWRHAVATRSIFQMEHRVRRSDGEFRFFSARGIPVLDTENRVREWVGAHADITERKRIETRDRFLSDAMEVLVSSLDYDTMLKGFAQLAIPTLGDFCFIDVFTPQRTIERAAWAHVDPEQHVRLGRVGSLAPPLEAPHDPIAQALRTGQTVHVPEISDDWCIRAAITPEHLAHMRLTQFRSLMAIPLKVGERVLGSLTVCFSTSGRQHTLADRELGEQLGRRAALALEHANLYRQSVERFEQLKRSEAALQKAKDQLAEHAHELEQKVAERTARLAETVQSLEGLTYTIAHDLRAPLRAMEGLSAMLVEDYGQVLDGTGQEYARRIQAAAHRMDRLIQDLLAYGRLNQIELALAPTSLEEIFAKTTELLADEIRARQGCVSIEHPLPAVMANAVLLEQILANLVTNALKFVAPGLTPEVRIWAEPHGDFLRVWVADNGIGIEPKYHARIFNMFERLHAQEYTGTGVGLAIVRKGTERMQGRVGLESQPGRGSKFWIELPRVDSR